MRTDKSLRLLIRLPSVASVLSVDKFSFFFHWVAGDARAVYFEVEIFSSFRG